MSEEIEKSIGFAASKNIHKKKAWEKSLKEGYRDYKFKGDPGNAGKLMEAFSDGKRYVRKTYEKRGCKIEEPRTVIVTDDTVLDSAFAGNTDYVYVKASFLEQQSTERHPKQSVTVERDDKAVVHKGKIIDYFALSGVAEMHHALFQQVKGAPSAHIAPDDTSLAEYDAQDVEFHALRWQLRYAREKNMPVKTVQTLNERLENAKEVRRQQGKIKTSKKDSESE